MFHSGAIQALNVAVERLPGRVLVLRQGALFPPVPPVEVESTDGDGQRRAAAFRRALLHLQEGDFVVLALDVAQGAGLPVSCLGRTLALARGPFALARRSGVPLRPLVAFWERGRIGVEVGEEIAATPGLEGPDLEAALAAASARWLEDHLRASPAELTLSLLHNLLTTDAGGPGGLDGLNPQGGEPSGESRPI
jgi:hypothetical protein